MKFNRLFIAVLLTTALAVIGLSAAESEPKPFFLPKSPVAAAYVLGRLSNQELIAAPRSEFVYVALLQRKGLERKYRFEALEGLAKLRNTDLLTELLVGLTDLDKKGAALEPVLRDLLPLLLQSPSASLTAKRPGLGKLATESRLSATRQIAYAGIVTADSSVERAWQAAESNPKQLTDLLLAIPLLRDPNLRTAFQSKVEPLLHQADPVEVRRAAITAVAAIPGNDTKTFTTLSALVKSGVEREAAVASIQRIPRSAWPRDQVGALIESLIAYLQGVPVAQRTEAEALGAFQFATDLTALLPVDQVGAFGKILRGLGVSVFVIRTVPEQMLYDKTLIVVEAGKPMSIVLINEDAMPHNLVITTPGALEEIGTAAEKMPPEADARGRLYVPDSPKVLHATVLIEAGQQTKLSFTAPKAPGDYHYVCTFPGHWRRMVGTLAVVTNVEAYLASHAAAPPTMTEWTTDDLAPELSQLDAGRNLARGREAFTKLACASCHKIGVDGVNFGPELTDVFPRYQNNPLEVLRHIIEPSLVISNRYRGYDFELQNSDELSGLIAKEEGGVLTVQSGAAAALIQTVKQSDIKSQKSQKSSLMPSGLLNTLSAAEILDLLAFLKAGGNLSTHSHQH